MAIPPPAITAEELYIERPDQIRILAMMALVSQAFWMYLGLLGWPHTRQESSIPMMIIPVQSEVIGNLLASLKDLPVS